MPLLAERVETGFQILAIQVQLVRESEKIEIVCRRRHYDENDVPQPQAFFALGLSKTNPDCMSDSW